MVDLVSFRGSGTVLLGLQGPLGPSNPGGKDYGDEREKSNNTVQDVDRILVPIDSTLDSPTMRGIVAGFVDSVPPQTQSKG
jgi:hypothetical protein